MNKKLLLEYEEGYGDNGFDLVECVNDMGDKFVFMVSYNFDGSVNFVNLIWSRVEDKKFVKECEDKLWKLEDIFDWERD